jgi:hypothetical protein
LQIYDIYSLIVPCHDDVFILGVNVIKNNVWTCMLASFTLVLITWHGCLCIKKWINVIASAFGIHKDNPNCLKEWTFFSKCITSITTHNLNHTHQEKDFKFHFQTPYISIMVTEIEFNR